MNATLDGGVANLADVDQGSNAIRFPIVFEQRLRSGGMSCGDRSQSLFLDLRDGKAIRATGNFTDDMQIVARGRAERTPLRLHANQNNLRVPELAPESGGNTGP